MGTRGSSSRNSWEVADDTPESRGRKPREYPAPPDIGWIRGERRLPENARIRRWMDLGDQALRDSDEDEEGPDPK